MMTAKKANVAAPDDDGDDHGDDKDVLSLQFVVNSQ